MAVDGAPSIGGLEAGVTVIPSPRVAHHRAGTPARLAAIPTPKSAVIPKLSATHEPMPGPMIIATLKTVAERR